jgi:hypothetical protein
MTRARDVADTQENNGGGVAPFVAGKNKVINGDFGVWQRGTSFAFGSPIYTVDRWQVGTQSNVSGRTVSRQASGLTGFQYCTRVARDNGNTSTSSIFLTQSIESSNSYQLAGQTVSLSFYARSGANYSSPSSRLNAKLAWGTGTDQNVLTAGYTGQTNAIDSLVTLTTSWQRFTLTGTIGSTATEIGLLFTSDTVGTAGAADYYEITGIQLEAGNVATPFTTATGTIQGELAACQRYCYVIQGNATNASSLGTGYWNGATAVVGFISSKSKMRTTPTLIFSAASDFEALQVGVSWNAVSAVTLAAETNADTAQISVTTTGGVSGQAANIRLKALSTAYVGLVAEL